MYLKFKIFVKPFYDFWRKSSISMIREKINTGRNISN